MQKVGQHPANVIGYCQWNIGSKEDRYGYEEIGGDPAGAAITSRLRNRVFCVEHAQAQPVNIPHSPPAPAVNPSSPNTVPHTRLDNCDTNSRFNCGTHIQLTGNAEFRSGRCRRVVSAPPPTSYRPLSSSGRKNELVLLPTRPDTRIPAWPHHSWTTASCGYFRFLSRLRLRLALAGPLSLSLPHTPF